MNRLAEQWLQGAQNTGIPTFHINCLTTTPTCSNRPPGRRQQEQAEMAATYKKLLPEFVSSQSLYVYGTSCSLLCSMEFTWDEAMWTDEQRKRYDYSVSVIGAPRCGALSVA